MISLYDGISEMYPSGGEKKAVCVKPKRPLDVGLRPSVTVCDGSAKCPASEEGTSSSLVPWHEPSSWQMLNSQEKNQWIMTLASVIFLHRVVFKAKLTGSQTQMPSRTRQAGKVCVSQPSIRQPSIRHGNTGRVVNNSIYHLPKRHLSSMKTPPETILCEQKTILLTFSVWRLPL